MALEGGAVLCARLPVTDMWAEPAPGAERVSQVLLGARLLLLDAVEGYVYVQSPDTYRGWVRRDETAPAPQETGQPMLVGALRAPLFPEAGSSEPCGEAWIGTRVVVAGSADARQRIVLPERPAWVDAACLRPIPDERAPLDVAALLADACRLVGVPYLWGGGSPLGLDCSGFVQLVFRLQGRELLRDADLQTRHGVAVEPEDLEPGDLLFFGHSAEGMPTHVGIYLGGGQYIHAHGSGGRCVEVSLLGPALADGSWWGARRIG